MVWYGVSVVKCVLVDEGFFLNRRRLMEQGTMDVECLWKGATNHERLRNTGLDLIIFKTLCRYNVSDSNTIVLVGMIMLLFLQDSSGWNSRLSTCGPYFPGRPSNWNGSSIYDVKPTVEMDVKPDFRSFGEEAERKAKEKEERWWFWHPTLWCIWAAKKVFVDPLNITTSACSDCAVILNKIVVLFSEKCSIIF